VTWIRLDDNFADHPKVAAAGPLAGWVHVCGLVYCGRFLTDGFVPENIAFRLADFEGLGIATGGIRGVAEFGHDITMAELIERLVEVGLWEPCNGGYMIHDYLDYNPTREQVLNEREDRARRGSLGGRKSARQRRATQATAQAVAQAVAQPTAPGVPQVDAQAKSKENSTPYPYPDPYPKEEEEEVVAGATTEGACAPSDSPAQTPETAEKPKRARGASPEWPPQVVAFYETAKTRPNTAQVRLISDKIDPKCIPEWIRAIQAWREHGYRPTNVAGMIDWFVRGIPEHRGNGGTSVQERNKQILEDYGRRHSGGDP